MEVLKSTSLQQVELDTTDDGTNEETAIELKKPSRLIYCSDGVVEVYDDDDGVDSQNIANVGGKMIKDFIPNTLMLSFLARRILRKLLASTGSSGRSKNTRNM